MKRTILFSLLLIILLCSFSTLAGKKQCQKYRKKLDNIQVQQRQASSLKRSNSLSSREAKARDTWWQCESGKHKVNSKKKNKKSKKAHSKKRQPAVQYTKIKQSMAHKPLVPFATNRPLVVRSRYEGEKLQAWSSFYQLKKKCIRPKSMQQFANCAEDKRRQQVEFEKSY